MMHFVILSYLIKIKLNYYDLKGKKKKRAQLVIIKLYSNQAFRPIPVITVPFFRPRIPHGQADWTLTLMDLDLNLVWAQK